MITSGRPISRMLDDSCPHHVHVNIGHTTSEMLVGLNSGRVIAVLPECSQSVVPIVELLGDSSLCQLHGALDCAAIAVFVHDQVYVITSKDVIEQT
jgi:hypothetical protein